MMPNGRLHILLADDDPDALELASTLLGAEAEVDCAREPVGALRSILGANYDVLITDLDLVHGGDGLVLAVAMRYVHPRARTVLISGFPDFARALGEMRSALDLVLTKPLEAAALRELSRLAAEPAARPDRGGAPEKSSLWGLLQRHQNEILEAWLKLVEAEPRLHAAGRVAARRERVAGLFAALAVPSRPLAERRQAGERRWHLRRRARTECLTLEVSCLRRAIHEEVLRDLLELDMSRFPSEMLELDERLDAGLLEALRAA